MHDNLVIAKNVPNAPISDLSGTETNRKPSKSSIKNIERVWKP